MEVFIKRAENSYKSKLGEDKTTSILNNIKKATNEIPAKFRKVIGSEIPKSVFLFSQEIEDLSPDTVEGVLEHILLFAESFKSLLNKDNHIVNQMLINRSNNTIRNLSELLKAFIQKAKESEIMESSGNFEDILTFILGGKAEITQFSDTELFIKRAEKKFYGKLGEEQSHFYSEEILKALNEIDEQHRDYMNSEISKFLFTFSQNIEELSPESLKHILDHAVLFLNAIKDLEGKTQDQINQEIIRRSKNRLRTLIDLFGAFLEGAKEGKILESCENLNEILDFHLGEERERVQFSDVDAFLKRAERKYALIVGQDMIQMLMDDLLEAIDQIPEQHREYLGSDLAKFLFKFSETASYHEPEKVELGFNGAIMFANTLGELGDLTKAEINQFIINRSNHKVRSLFELYKAFLEKIKIRMPLSAEPNFDDILNHTLGRYEGPKLIEKGGLIHDLLEDYHEEVPLAKEHSSWAKSIAEIIPRFLDILPNSEGDRILDLLWENKFPEDQILEKFREKISEMPREKEKTFTFRLLNMLTNQVLEDENKDKVLTSALAFRILGTIFIEMFGGRNTEIRAIRLNQLLKDRKIANIEKKKNLDEHINRILEEDLKAIQQRTMTINTIIPIISKKGFFIKTYDIVTKDFPELIVKIISYRPEERLKDIGKEYKKAGVSGELIQRVNEFLQQLDLAKVFYKKYFEEMYSITMDAQKNMLALRKFFKSLVDLSEKMDAIEFYEIPICNAEHGIYIALLTYLYEPLPDIFNTTNIILYEQEYQRKIIKLDNYLSYDKLEQLKLEIRETENKIKEYEDLREFDTTDKIRNLTKFLNRDKNEIKFFDIMFKLLDMSKEVDEILQSRLQFSIKLLEFSNSLKKIHPNLPGALSDYLEKLSEFNQEVDNTIEKIKEKSASGIISPFEFKERNDEAITVKKELLSLSSNEEFLKNIENLVKFSK